LITSGNVYLYLLRLSLVSEEWLYRLWRIIDIFLYIDYTGNFKIITVFQLFPQLTNGLDIARFIRNKWIADVILTNLKKKKKFIDKIT